MCQVTYLPHYPRVHRGAEGHSGDGDTGSVGGECVEDLATAASGGTKQKLPAADALEGNGDANGHDKNAGGAVVKKKKRDEIWESTFNAIKNQEEAEAKLVNGDGSNGGRENFPGGVAGGKKGKDTSVDANIWLGVTDSQY